MCHLQDLAVRLMQQQGTSFFLNEYPEECEHRQFLDLDANISKDTLERIIISLQELSTEGEVQVLCNTVSNKVHLIIDTPAYSTRHSIHKKAVANWLCKYLYDSADLSADYTLEEWHDIFDLKAASIRCAFSVKVKGGKLESEGVYAPPSVDPSTLTPSEKVCILTEHSIYAPAWENWTKDALAAFEATKIKLQANEEAKVDKYKIISEYYAKKKSIEFLGKKHQVSGALINEFIYLVPKMCCDSH
jgi:hypothetical protein